MKDKPERPLVQLNINARLGGVNGSVKIRYFEIPEG